MFCRRLIINNLCRQSHLQILKCNKPHHITSKNLQSLQISPFAQLHYLRLLTCTNNSFTTSKIPQSLQILPFSRPCSSFNNEKYIQGRENRFKKEDNIPEDWEMIYRAPFLNYVKALHSASLISIIGVLGVGSIQINSYSFGDQLVTVDVFSSNLTTHSLLEISFFAGGLFVMNLMAQLVIREYVYRIYQKEEEYKMVQMGLLPWMKKVVDFRAGDLKEYDGLPTIPWSSHRFKAKDKVVILIEEYFKTPSHLINMFKVPKKSS